MPPTGYFGSRLRRSIILASFVRALAEAGSRDWSADKLNAGSQCQWCSRQRLSNSHAPAVDAICRASAKRLTSRKSSRQSNVIARWPRRVIHQTMASKARVRPTSGQTRSNAANTTPDPCFIAPLRGCLYFRCWSGRAAAFVPTRFNRHTSNGSGHGPCT